MKQSPIHAPSKTHAFYAGVTLGWRLRERKDAERWEKLSA